jgi:hypothetical protein
MLDINDIELLIKAVEAWENQCGCKVELLDKQKFADNIALKIKESGDIFGAIIDTKKEVESAIDAELASRKEPSILLRGKLIALRDDLILEQAKNMIKGS